MMKTMRILRILICGALVWLVGVGAVMAEEPVIRGTESLQPMLITPIFAVLPLQLQNLLISNPRAVAKVQVNYRGRVEDMVVLEASHPDLIERAEGLIRGALFDPGFIRQGQAVRFDVILNFAHPSDLAPGSLTVLDDMEMAINRVARTDYTVRLHTPKELDAIPQLIEEGDVYRSVDETGEVISGEAMVRFYIDFQGRVRLPRIISSTNEVVAMAALESVLDMRFAPPTVNGRPAVTQATLPFSIK